MKRTTERLMRSVGAAADALAGLFSIQLAACLTLALVRADAVGGTALQAAGASLALLGVSLCARAQSRTAPAPAAGVVAGLMLVEALMWGVLVGVPPLPVFLQVTLSVLVYGGLLAMAVAAACAGRVLAQADLRPVEVADSVPRRSPRRRHRHRPAA